MELLKKLKSYFKSDQVQMFVLFLDDFFPSEKLFNLFGFPFFDGLHNAEDEKLKIRKRRIFWFSVLLTLFFTFLSFANFILIVGKHEKFEESVESFGAVVVMVFVLLKALFLCYWKRKAIKDIIDRFEKHLPHTNLLQLQFGVNKNYKIIKMTFYIILIFYNYLWIHYSVIAFFSFCSEFFDLNLMKVQLLMPIYYPLDPYQPWLYPIFFFFEVWIVFMITMIFASTDLLFCSLVAVNSMEFDILAQKISQIDPESDEQAEGKLEKIIDAYNDLYEITKKVEEIFSLILLGQVFQSIIALCVVVFLSFTPQEFQKLIKFMSALPFMFIQCFCACYYSQQLQTSSMRVADEAYNCNWYGKNLKFRKMILLTMLRAPKPQKLTGWKFMDIGLPVFYWILKTIFSIYSILRGLYEA
ncbi:hypothetical protein PVAND_000295 [Polypedilum vanderplanki]|uniref:Odorant receptor n=1 Tax=Polypedilum vanderplanki TaxID=319348 RepID=A0A9J6BJW9_POLVA|nr:hypothetical protein PVAND_000295 [Polypedilum vanderplanki]